MLEGSPQRGGITGPQPVHPLGQVVDAGQPALDRLDEDRRSSTLGVLRSCASTAARAGDDSRTGPRVTVSSSWSRVRRTSAKPLRRLLRGAGTTRCTRPWGSAVVMPCSAAAVAPARTERSPAQSNPATRRCRGRAASRVRMTTCGSSTRQARPLFHLTAAGETPPATSWARVTTPSWRAMRASRSFENSGMGPSVARSRCPGQVTPDPVDQVSSSCRPVDPPSGCAAATVPPAPAAGCGTTRVLPPGRSTDRCTYQAVAGVGWRGLASAGACVSGRGPCPGRQPGAPAAARAARSGPG